MELSASFIGAIGGGAVATIYTGLTLRGFFNATLSAFVGFLVVLIFIRTCYLITAPRGLDKRLRNELAEALSALKQEKAKKPDVDVEIQSVRIGLRQESNSSKQQLPFFQFQAMVNFSLHNKRPNATTVKELYLILMTEKNEAIQGRVLLNPETLTYEAPQCAFLEQGKAYLGEQMFLTRFIAKDKIPRLKSATLIVIDAYGDQFTSQLLDIACSSDEQIAEHWMREDMDSADK